MCPGAHLLFAPSWWFFSELQSYLVFIPSACPPFNENLSPARVINCLFSRMESRHKGDLQCHEGRHFLARGAPHGREGKGCSHEASDDSTWVTWNLMLLRDVSQVSLRAVAFESHLNYYYLLSLSSANAITLIKQIWYKEHYQKVQYLK